MSRFIPFYLFPLICLVLTSVLSFKFHFLYFSFKNKLPRFTFKKLNRNLLEVIAFNVNDRILFNLLFICRSLSVEFSLQLSFHLNSLSNFLQLEKILQNNQITFYSLPFPSSLLSYGLVEIQTYCSSEEKRSFSIQQIKIFSLTQTIFIGISLFNIAFSFQVVQFKNNHFRLLFHEHFSSLRRKRICM